MDIKIDAGRDEVGEAKVHGVYIPYDLVTHDRMLRLISFAATWQVLSLIECK